MRSDIRRKVGHAVSSVAIAGALAACGGGGGGANVRPTPPPPVTPPPTDDGAGEAAQDYLSLINADQTIEAGQRGAGITIGVVDTGVDRDHPALRGRVVANFVHVDGENDLDVDDAVGRGTVVATLAAGRPVGEWPGGVAPDATIASARVVPDASFGDDGSGRGRKLEVDDDLIRVLGIVNTELEVEAGARILNYSWGNLYWDDPAVTERLWRAYQNYVAWGGLFVFAAGNGGEDPVLASNPGELAALPGRDATTEGLQKGWLVVGAVDSQDPSRLAPYSQACGVAMDYCLVAPGDVSFTGADDAEGEPTYQTGGDTAYAAALVSGAAAVVWSVFPDLTNDVVRQILLGTATDLGEEGADPVFGRGMLDLAKAVKGPARFDWGDVTVEHWLNDMTWSNPISGEGGLVKNGLRSLVLTASSTYSGDTRVLGGTLRLQGGISLASDVSVHGPIGIFAGHGSVPSLRNEGGTVFVDDHDMTVRGDFHQDALGELRMILGNKLKVGGTAHLDGSLSVAGVLPEYLNASRVDVLEAGAISGKFSQLFSRDGVFIDATIDYSPTKVTLDIERLDVSATATALGLSTASQSGAVRVEQAFRLLDANGSSAVAPGFLAAAGKLQRTASAAAAEQSLSSLSGELHAAGATFAQLAADSGRRAVASRLDSPQRTGAWAALLDGSSGFGNGFASKMSGWMIGQQLRDGSVTWGTGFARLEGSLWRAGRRDRGRDLQTEAQLYAFSEGRDGRFVLGRAAFGRMQRHLEREILIGVSSYPVDSRYADQYWSASLEGGWRFDAAGGTLTPYFGAQALRLRNGRFAEHGAVGFSLRAGASRLASDEGLLGLRYARSWDAGATQLEVQAHAEWQRRLSQSGGIQAAFTGVDATAPISLDVRGRDVGVFGARLLADWGNTQLSLDFDARQSFDRTDVGAAARWLWSF